MVWEKERDVPKPRKCSRKEKGIDCVKDRKSVWQREVGDLAFAADSLETTGVLSESYCGEDGSLIWVGSRDRRGGGGELQPASTHDSFWGGFQWREADKKVVVIEEKGLKMSVYNQK